MANVNVEFAGLVVAIVSADKKSVSVVFPDARSVGGPAHRPVLLVKDVAGLKGEPDFAVTLKSDRTKLTDEYAGWFVHGNVEFNGDFAPFTAPDLRQTMDLNRVAAATKLIPANQRPLSATVQIRKGQLKSLGFPLKFDFHYMFGGDEKTVYGKGNEVELTERLEWSLGDLRGPVEVSFNGQDGLRKAVKVPEDVGEPLIISNLAGGSGKSTAHFDAFYVLLADRERSPLIKRTQLKSDIPDNPDECRAAVFQE